MGEDYLMKVIPVEWYIDEDARILISKELIFSGIRYIMDGNDTKFFEHTYIKSFLNIVKNEMFRNLEHDKQIEPLNIDNDEWLIENSVVKKYRGNQKDVIVPEGVTTIESFFSETHLESIKFPKTTSKIYWSALPESIEDVYFPNNMATFALLGILTSHAKNFYFDITSNLIIASGAKISEDLTLHIDCSMTDYNNTFIRLEEILPQFGPVKVILYGVQNINAFKKLEIMKRFPQYEFIFKDKFEEKTIDKQEIKEEILKDVVDPELKERLDTITYSTKYLEENQRNIIIEKVKEILENAKEAQENMKPTLDFNSKSGIALTNEPNNVKSLHYSVITELDNIITFLNRNIESINFLKELSRIENNLHSGNVTKPEKIESINDKIDFICFVCKEYGNKEINDRFQKLLDKTQETISKQISNFNQHNLMLESPSTYFKLKAESIFIDAEKYEWLISTLEAKADNDLSHDIKSINSIINKLDKANRNKYSCEMNTIVNKYKASDLNKTKEEITQEIRKDLDTFLSDLSKIVNNSVKHKTIVDSINYCLNAIFAKNINGLSEDIRIGNSIYEILSKCPKEIYDDTLNKIIKTLKEWQVKLIEDKDIANEYLNEKDELGKDTFKSLDSPSIVYIAVLKDFEDIKYAVDTYINQKNFYENNKRVY